MAAILNEKLQEEFVRRGFNRRNFGRIAAMIAGGATLPFYNEPALAQLSKVTAPADAVLINASAALFVAGKTRSLAEGRDLAVETIDSGRARVKLKELAS